MDRRLWEHESTTAQHADRKGATVVTLDVGKDEEYGKLAGMNLQEDETRARVEPDPLKRNPRDFVLRFSQSKYPNQLMKWESPWGYGSPGWHIECSAMASKYIGGRIDIHTGGVDHIPVHHTNEIAQSEGRFWHRWVDVWMHAGFLVLEGDRMSKSGQNFLRLNSLQQMGFENLKNRVVGWKLSPPRVSRTGEGTNTPTDFGTPSTKI